ncbi:hypothetical protein [Streptomyces synnematoformans]|uniref:Sulfotransferase family protein n=1 Tax=Streptomyces synnematoformans TaxID=415721 RepID=A0ABN2XQW1_9ACTN
MPPHASAVPPGTRLLHIGPHKTGTTAVQGAFHQARDRLHAHGVHYAGKQRMPGHAVGSRLGLSLAKGEAPPDIDHWRELRDEVTAAGDRRVVVSCEFFANADPDALPEVVEELGGDAVHVVVTLRPLVRILPSQWQEYVQNGLRSGYEEWLDDILRKRADDGTPTAFWRRHRHDALVERWAAVVGPDNVTVVVVDETDPLALLRMFEELTGLPEGVLRPDSHVNPSLTLGEAEMLRRLNEATHERGWPDRRYVEVIRHGVRFELRKPRERDAGEPRAATPEWAVDEAVAVAEEMTGRIAGLGVRIVGDPARLTRRPTAQPAPAGPPMVHADVAARAVLAAVQKSAPKRKKKAQPPPRMAPAAGARKPASAEDRPVREVSAATLVRILRRRGLRRLRRRMPRGRGPRG